MDTKNNTESTSLDADDIAILILRTVYRGKGNSFIYRDALDIAEWAIKFVDENSFNPNWPFYENKYKLESRDRKAIRKRIEYLQDSYPDDNTPAHDELSMLRKIIAYENERLKEAYKRSADDGTDIATTR